MDIVTHALQWARVSRRERLLLGGTAAAFPDIDFVTFPINPLLFPGRLASGADAFVAVDAAVGTCV